MPTGSNTTRIAKNTLFLYLRTFIVMVVNIYLSRVILKVLGIEDYGIYTVVGGFVAMFSMVTNSLTGACQRFFSYEIENPKHGLNKTFSATITVHLILVVVILLILETIGLWFINFKMNIASDRLYATNWVYQCSILTFCITLLSVPYNAFIIAYERMHIFAYVSIIEVLLKLLFTYLLLLFASDRLIIYAVFMLLIAFIVRLLYGVYCNKNFRDAKFRLLHDKILYKELLNFCGWNFFGTSAGVINNHGTNILINLFFGVTFNAARGVANQVSGAVGQFVGNFVLAVNPQITKSYAAGNFEYSNQLICKGAKYSALLLWIVALPLIIKMDSVLNIWLVEVPEKTTLFAQLALFYAMTNSWAHTLYFGILTTGRIKNYHLIVSGINLACFPFSYIMFKMGLPVEWGYINAILFNLIALGGRLIVLKKEFKDFSPRKFLKDVMMRIIFVCSISFLCAYFVNLLFSCEKNITDVISFTIICILLTVIVTFIIGIDINERRDIKQYVTRIIKERL